MLLSNNIKLSNLYLETKKDIVILIISLVSIPNIVQSMFLLQLSNLTQL